MILNFKCLSLTHIDGKTFLPGVNVVDAEWWAIQRKHPLLKFKIEEGEIEEEDFEEPLEPKDEQPQKQKPKTITDYKETQAKKYAKECVVIETLKEWEQIEKRESVLKIIRAQIEKITAPNTPRQTPMKDYVNTGRAIEVIEVSATPSAIDD